MARERSPNRDKAYEIYKAHNGNIKLIDIAEELGVKDTQVRKWKSQDQWEQKLKGTLPKVKSNVTKLKKNKGNAIKEPIAEEVKELMENDELTDKQRLFCVLYSQTFNASKSYQQAYKCTYETAMVEGSKCLRKPKIKEQLDKLIAPKCNKEYLKRGVLQKYIDIAFAKMGDYVKFGKKYVPVWTKDKDGAYIPVIDPNTGEQKVNEYNYVDLNESSMVDTSLISEVSEGKDGIKFKLISKEKALDFLNKHCNLLSDEEKTQLDLENKRLQNEKLEIEIEKARPSEETQGINYRGIPSTMIAPAFSKAVFDIDNREHLEYVLPGGRGSTKSSFISLQIIDLLMKNDTMHACVLRQVDKTIRTSVYQQMMWAINALGLEDEFDGTVSPMEITRKSTGQKIYFRGANDPDSIKSIKVPFGYIGVAWFEELDQFQGPEAVRKIEQSLIRGGDVAYIFKSFNPPKSANNWANKYVKIPKATRLVVESTYLDVPKQWLGKPFIDEAEFLKEVNPEAYENEYLGVANGNGGNVFDNVEIREITNEEIEHFDRIYNGVDWGWFPDPWAFNRMYFNAAKRELYIFDEAHANKKSNRETADILINEHGIKPNDKIVCDSAENKSIGDYKSYGLFARGAIKGPGSVDYSMKWLQSLTKIVIDRARCPKTADEFLDYEYERDKEGNVISGYPDANNHHIDAVRYAMEEVWKRKGQ